MSAVKQIAAIVSMNTRAMRARVVASLVIVIGMAAVVAVGLAIYGVASGARELIRQTSPTPDRMAIVSKGALGGGPSNIPRDQLAILADTPGLKIAADGTPFISGTVGSSFIATRKDNGTDGFVSVTGVAPNRVSGRAEIKITEGRIFTPGLREMIAGKGAVARFQDIAVGKDVLLRDGPWTIVGIFEGAGTTDYNLWTDSDTLAAAMRVGSYGVVYAVIQDGSTAGQDAFKAALTSNPGVSVEATTEQAWRLRGASGNIEFYSFLAYWIGGIMAFGTIVAALNTMYAAVSARHVEIATLRAIGFSPAPVVISVIIECLALAILGATLGALIAWIFFNDRGPHYQVRTYYVVTSTMILAGIGVALVVGFVGALFPAIRAARQPVAAALQVR